MKRTKMQIKKIDNYMKETEKNKKWLAKNSLFEIKDTVYTEIQMNEKLKSLKTAIDNSINSYRRDYNIELLCSDATINSYLSPNLFRNEGDEKKLYFLVRAGNIYEIKKRIKRIKTECTNRFNELETYIYEDIYINEQLRRCILKPCLDYLEKRFDEEVNRIKLSCRRVAEKEAELRKIIAEL